MKKESLKEKTYEELRKLASKKKIEGRSKMKKDELVKAILKSQKGSGLLNNIKSIPGRVIGSVLPRLPYRNLPTGESGRYNEFTGEFISNENIIANGNSRFNENENFIINKEKRKKKQYDFYKMIDSKIPESESVKVMIYPKNKENPVEYLLKNHTHFDQPDSGYKPKGAWLSNKFKEKGNWTWVNFVISENFNNKVHPLKNDIYLVKLIDDKEKILRLKTPLDMINFTLKYGVLTQRSQQKLERMKKENYYGELTDDINWKKVQDDGYYGIDISPYIFEMREQLIWYFGWDCSSQCIWDYRGIKSITKLNTDEELRSLGFV